MKTEILIPESLEEITLEQYQKFVAIEEPTTEDSLSVFLKLTLDQINNIKSSEVDRLTHHVNSLFEEKQQHQLRFKLDGTEFGFIPKLDDITYGENKDITTYLNDWKDMHKAMAVLYRPIKQKQGNKYLIVDYKGSAEYSELMKRMPLSVVMGSMVFFYHLTNELLKAIPNYLEKVTEKQLMKGQISEENGEVIKKLIPSLKEMLEDMTKLQDYHYINA